MIIITNLVDLGAAVFGRYFDRKRVAGMCAQQDSLRFARTIASRLDVHRVLRARQRARRAWGGQGPGVELGLPHGRGSCAPLGIGRPPAQFDDSDEASATQSAMAQVGHPLDAERVASAYRLIGSASPQAKIMVEPFMTVAWLRSTPNATTHATLA